MSDRDPLTPPRTRSDAPLTRSEVDDDDLAVPTRAETSDSMRMLGRFEILRELGRGGMGRVFKAWDPAQREQVAVKVLLGFNSAAFYRFKREFRSLAEVAHPNLVKLHELFFENGRLFFSMELLEGKNFVEYVRDRGADAGTTRTALQQLVLGVDALHQAGKLHRDVKPSNIIVTPDGRVVLLDFGLIRERDDPDDVDLTAPGAVLGTPAYMSPEQAAGLRLGPESDWYAVGLVLYEALTGKRAFEERNPARLMRMRLETEPPPPSTMVADVPADLDALCVKLLRTHASDRPSRDEILAAVGIEEPTPLTPRPDGPSSSGRFVGRELELERLSSALKSAASGRTVCVFLDGPSGIGKSELIRQFLRAAAGSVGDVLSGRCYERESVPYKAFDSIVDSIAEKLRNVPNPERARLLPPGIDALARLFPALGRVASISPALHSWETAVDDNELRSRAFAALRELFTRLSAEGPLVLTIDDLQWCDMDSVALLLELLQPPDPPPMLIVASHRSDVGASSRALATLFRALDSDRYPVERHELRLAPLGADECVALAERLLGPDDSDLSEKARAIANESDGSPFFVGELVRFTQQRGRGAHDALGIEAPRLEQVIASRIAALPEPSRKVLETVAIAGQRIEQGVALRAALGERPDRRAIDLLRGANLVRTQGVNDRDWIETYHDPIRFSVFGGLDEENRRARHLVLAETMARLGRSDPDALATHFAQAGAGERTVPHALQAARAAAKALAFIRAVEWFEVALDNLPPDDAQRVELEIELGTAYANAGHSYEAAQAFLRAAERVDDERRARLRQRAAHLLVSGGSIGEARVMLRELLASAGLEMPGSSRSALITLLLLRGRIALRGLDYVERRAEDIPPEDLYRIDLCWAAGHLVPFDTLVGASFMARHLLLALEAGEPARIAPALAMEAASRFIAGSSTYEESKNLFRRAEQVADRSGSAEARAWVAASRPAVHLLAGEWTEAAAQARTAAELLRQHAVGAGVSVLTAQFIELWARYQMGDWGEMEIPLRRLLRAGGKHNPLHWTVRSLLAMPVALAKDQAEAALEEFEAYAALPSDEVVGSAEIAVFNGTVAANLYLGQATRAWAIARERRRALGRALRFRDPLSRATYHFSTAQAAIAGFAADGDRSAAAEASKALRRLTKTGFRPAPTLAALAEAGLANVRGDRAHAEQLLRRCVEEFDRAQMKVHAAVARHRLGTLIQGQRGHTLAREAAATMEQLGIARPDRLVRVLAGGFEDQAQTHDA